MRTGLHAALAAVSVLASPVLSGCALPDAGLASAVPADLALAEAVPLAAAMADLTTRRVPASSGAIVVLAPAGDAALTSALLNDLRAAGYTVADSGPHRLAYQVNALGGDVLVRMDLDDARAARLFTRTAGGLSAAGAFSVREPQEAAR